jgi:hypothetical protein
MLPGAVVAGVVGGAPLASGTVALPAAPTGRAPQFAPVMTGGPSGVNDATVFDAQRVGVYGGAGQAQPRWPGVGAPAAPRRTAQRSGGFCLPVISALVVFALVVAAAYFVANALRGTTGAHPGGSPTTGFTKDPTPSPSPTATVAPTATATVIPTDTLTASPPSLTFNCTSPSSLSQTVTLSNTSQSDITWHVASLTAGARVNPSSGSLASGESTPITIRYLPTTYQQAGRIIFSVRSPEELAGQRATVTFTVTGCALQ